MQTTLFYTCFFWVLAAAVAGCTMKQPPYLKHKLVSSQKLSEGCVAGKEGFKMTSNIIGERYQFEKCLNATYDGHYTVQQLGDTVVLNFTKAAGAQALYQLTVDIDAYPRYHFLTVDGSTFAIVPTAN